MSREELATLALAAVHIYTFDGKLAAVHSLYTLDANHSKGWKSKFSKVREEQKWISWGIVPMTFC